MALLFKPHAGKNKAALDKEELVEGHFWFTTDDGKSYIDAKNSSGILSRILLNAGTADALTVKNVGGPREPIYINANGIPVPCTIAKNVGGPREPVYIDANGIPTPCTSTLR